MTRDYLSVDDLTGAELEGILHELEGDAVFAAAPAVGLDGQGDRVLETIGTMYRYAAPQRGRYREHWQLSVEAIGSADPAIDAEVIQLYDELLARLGVTNYKLLLNSIGDAKCRPAYVERLTAWLDEHADVLDEDARQKRATNPLRVFDVKNPQVLEALAEAPKIGDALCDECRAHFEAVQAYLEDQAVQFTLSPTLVRGLDYYTRTVFEAYAAGLGAQNAVGGGGRYDQLVRDFGGPQTPAIGFSIGMERLLLATGSLDAGAPLAPDVCIIALEPTAVHEALVLARALRGAKPEGAGRGLRVMVDVAGRSASAQMKWASKIQARHAVFVPMSAEGYAVKGMRAGKDEPRQPSRESLEAWLLTRVGAEGAER
jgi:histidyl-tRNA synthetase